MCILNSLHPLEVPPGWRFYLHRWPLRSVLHDGVNLWNHSRRFEEMQQVLFATMRPRKSRHKYDSICMPREPTQRRRNQTLEDTSIKSVATKDCCAKRCCQLSPHDKIKYLRQKMWLGDFRMRSAKKLEVHRNMHFDAGGRKVVTLENVEVCCRAWYIIHAVSKADLNRFLQIVSKLLAARTAFSVPWQLMHKEAQGGNTPSGCNIINHHYAISGCDAT